MSFEELAEERESGNSHIRTRKKEKTVITKRKGEGKWAPLVTMARSTMM